MRSRALVLAAAVAALAACRSQPAVRPEAFDRGQRIAILSLQAPPKIAIWADPGAVGPDLDATPVLAEIRRVVVDELAKNPHFTLVPEAKVFAAPAYAAHPAATEPSGYVSPAGYKPVTDEAIYPQLAREAGADMGLALVLNLLYRSEDGAAAIVISVGAIDTRGRGVWKGGAAVVSDRRVDVRTSGPKARIDAYRDAARRAMAQLEEDLTSQLAVERALGRAKY